MVFLSLLYCICEPHKGLAIANELETATFVSEGGQGRWLCVLSMCREERKRGNLAQVYPGLFICLILSLVDENVRTLPELYTNSTLIDQNLTNGQTLGKVRT